MPYLNDTSETDWYKLLFDKLTTVENKLDQMLVLQEQNIDITIHPPLKAEYLDIIDTPVRDKFIIQIVLTALIFLHIPAAPLAYSHKSNMP